MKKIDLFIQEQKLHNDTEYAIICDKKIQIESSIFQINKHFSKENFHVWADFFNSCFDCLSYIYIYYKSIGDTAQENIYKQFIDDIFEDVCHKDLLLDLKDY